jgi:hypothetical protein
LPSASTTRPTVRADRHFQDAAGALDGVAFRDVFVFTQNHGADRVALEVQRQAEGVAREFEHFALHHVGQAVDAHDTVGHGDHGALVANVSARFKALMRLLISSLISEGLSCIIRS